MRGTLWAHKSQHITQLDTLPSHYILLLKQVDAMLHLKTKQLSSYMAVFFTTQSFIQYLNTESSGVPDFKDLPHNHFLRRYSQLLYPNSKSIYQALTKCSTATF